MQEAHLEGLPLFENLTFEEKAELATLLEPVSFVAGEAILEEGGLSEYLYVLSSGTVEVHKEVFPERRQHLATIEAPAVVGEMALMTEPRAAATCTAKSQVEARRLPREAFLEKLEAGSDAVCKIAYKLGRDLAEKMAKTDEFMAEIVAELEDDDPDRDLDVFREKLVREWSF